MWNTGRIFTNITTFSIRWSWRCCCDLTGPMTTRRNVSCVAQCWLACCLEIIRLTIQLNSNHLADEDLQRKFIEKQQQHLRKATPIEFSIVIRINIVCVTYSALTKQRNKKFIKKQNKKKKLGKNEKSNLLWRFRYCCAAVSGCSNWLLQIAFSTLFRFGRVLPLRFLRFPNFYIRTILFSLSIF